jgi:hypothetical protein
VTTTITALRTALENALKRRERHKQRLADARAELKRARRKRSRNRAALLKVRGRIHALRHQIKAVSLSVGARAAIKWAASKVGTTEHPPGSNGGPRVSRWQADFGFGRVPWCGIFVGTALKHAGVQGVTSRIAGVSLIEDDAKASRAPFKGWGSASSAQPGDAVVLFGYGVHVELVVSNDPRSGVLHTIGGNTSFANGSQSNGGCVAARVRPYSDVRGIAHVNYGGAS